MRSSGWSWLTVLAGALVIDGMTMFFINGEAVVYGGDGVECDGSRMKPGHWCSRSAAKALATKRRRRTRRNPDARTAVD